MRKKKKFIQNKKVSSSECNRLGIKNEHSRHYKMERPAEPTRLFIEGKKNKSVPTITLRDNSNFNKNTWHKQTNL